MTAASRFRTACVLALASLLVLSLLAISWPRLRASLHYLAVERAIERYWVEGEIDPEQLASLQQRVAEAIAIEDHYRFHSGLSLLYYVQGIQDGSLYGRKNALESSIKEAMLALESAPIQPDLWLRIAQAGSVLFFPPEDIVASYKMAIYTGRVEPMHVVARVVLGYSLLKYLDEEAFSLLGDQTLLAWNLREGETVRAIKTGDLSMTEVESVIGRSHPDLLADMQLKLTPDVR